MNQAKVMILHSTKKKDLNLHFNGYFSTHLYLTGQNTLISRTKLPCRQCFSPKSKKS